MFFPLKTYQLSGEKQDKILHWVTLLAKNQICNYIYILFKKNEVCSCIKYASKYFKRFKDTTKKGMPLYILVPFPAALGVTLCVQQLQTEHTS